MHNYLVSQELDVSMLAPGYIQNMILQGLKKPTESRKRGEYIDGNPQNPFIIALSTAV